MESLILHEDHITDFKTSNKVLNRRTQVAATSPDILYKSDIVRVDPQRLRQPPVVELDALVLEEVIVVRLVKHLDAEHDKSGVVAPGQTDVVEVVEAGAELRANQGIRGRVQLTRHAVRLETEYAGRDIVNVVAPTCDNRIPFDRGARDPGTRQTLLETCSFIKNGQISASEEITEKEI